MTNKLRTPPHASTCSKWLRATRLIPTSSYPLPSPLLGIRARVSTTNRTPATASAPMTAPHFRRISQRRGAQSRSVTPATPAYRPICKYSRGCHKRQMNANAPNNMQRPSLGQRPVHRANPAPSGNKISMALSE